MTMTTIDAKNATAAAILIEDMFEFIVNLDGTESLRYLRDGGWEFAARLRDLGCDMSDWSDMVEDYEASHGERPTGWER